MSGETARRFMERLQEMERTGDPGGLVALFADDAELASAARPESFRGREGVRRFWEEYLSAFERVASRFTNVVDTPEVAVLEWVSEGALPGGRPLEYRGVSILEIRDGLVRRFRTYFDSAVFLPRGAPAHESGLERAGAETPGRGEPGSPPE